MIARRVFLAALVALASSEASGQNAPAVRDSAGIRIVEHGDVSQVVAPFRIAARPTYRVGWGTGPEWGKVMGGVLLAGGRAAIADQIESHVVVLKPDGTVEQTLGRAGQGPGELGQIWNVNAFGQDTIVVQEGFSPRLTLFHQGAFLRTVTAGGGMFAAMVLGGDGRGGLYLGGEVFGYSPNFTTPYLPVPLVRLDLATAVPARIGTTDYVPRPEGTTYNPFSGARGYTAAWSNGFVTGHGHERQLTWMDLNGKVVQIVRWRGADAPLTDAVWEAYKAARQTASSAAGASPPREGWNTFFANLKAAAKGPLPVFMGLLTDPAGNVWLADYDPGDQRGGMNHATPRYRILSPRGDWLGSIALPATVAVLDIGPDYILAVERDQLEVDAVSLYRIER